MSDEDPRDDGFEDDAFEDDQSDDDDSTVRVNFARPVPVFPINTVLLMPHGQKDLHIFEPRYAAMVADALDSSGQVALATFEGDAWRTEYHGRPPLRPAVCIAQIIQHHKLDEGRYYIRLRGICRARIIAEIPAGETQYREVQLAPLGSETGDEDQLMPYRERIAMMLDRSPLEDLADAVEVLEHMHQHEIPSTAIFELLTLKFVTDSDVRYKLLAAGEPLDRAEIVEAEMDRLRSLLVRARPQRDDDCPKGCNWN